MVEVYSERDIPSDKESGLSIKKGETFFIKNKLWEEDAEVYIANNKHGKSGEILVSDLGNTLLPEWFQVMDRQESEERLLEADFLEGDFIIRPATRGHDGDFSELPRNTIHHFKLTKIKNKDCVSNRSYKSLQAAVPNFTIRKAIKRKEMKVQELCVKSFTKYTDILNIF